MSETVTSPAPRDPCANYERLRDVYEKVVMGQSVRSVRYRNGEEERQTDFNPGNVAALKGLVAEAKAECEAARGMVRRRSAMPFSGFRRPPYGGM